MVGRAADVQKRQYIMETSRSMVTTLEISLTHLTQFKDLLLLDIFRTKHC